MFFYAAKYFMWLYIHLLYRLKITGANNIPAEGGFILCSNHLHSLDPATHTVSIKRRLSFMGKNELFRRWYGRWFFGKLGVFPVNRGTADLKSYKTALSRLNGGMGLMIFIQGTRMKEIDIKDAKGGAAMFALKTGVPIIPAGINSTYKIFSAIEVQYGAPVFLDEYKGRRINSELIDEITEKLMSEVRRLASRQTV